MVVGVVGVILGGRRPDIAWVMVKRGEEGIIGRTQGSRTTESTHVCGPVSSIIPNIIHQVRKVLQAVGDVMRKEQDAHCLHTHRHTQTIE